MKMVELYITTNEEACSAEFSEGCMTANEET